MSLQRFQAVVDKNNHVLYHDDGNIFVYNKLNNCTSYMEDTVENRVLLNLPLEQDENIEQSNNVHQQLPNNCSVNETNDGPKWSHETILLLLSLYEDNLGLFKSAKKTNKAVWNGVAGDMAKHGHAFTGDQCDIKFRNLKKTYKRIVDNNKGTDREAISWPYFDKFDQLFGKSADTVPVATASNTDGYSSRCSTPASDSGEPDLQSTPVGPSSIRKRRCMTSEEEPQWVKVLRKEAAERHAEKMGVLKALVNLLKNE